MNQLAQENREYLEHKLSEKLTAEELDTIYWWAVSIYKARLELEEL